MLHIMMNKDNMKESGKVKREVFQQEQCLYKEKDMLHIMMNKDNMKESGKGRGV